MKNFRLTVDYVFTAQFWVTAEHEVDAKVLIKDKVRVVAGINQLSVRIKDKEMSGQPTRIEFKKIAEI
jgi:hypothetical protein